jgi:hypothetical protein
MTSIPDLDFRAQPTGFSPTTAEILYRMDHPSLLQSYVWQDYQVTASAAWFMTATWPPHATFSAWDVRRLQKEAPPSAPER